MKKHSQPANLASSLKRDKIRSVYYSQKRQTLGHILGSNEIKKWQKSKANEAKFEAVLTLFDSRIGHCAQKFHDQIRGGEDETEERDNRPG